MILRIAGITIKLAVRPDCLPKTEYFINACSAYSIAESGRYDFKVTAGANYKVRDDAKAILTRNTVSYYEQGDSSIFYSDSSECCIRWKEKTATLQFAQNVDRYDVLFMDYIKMLLSFIVIDRGGLPLHSSAICNEKSGGIVFFCPSGGGKTTIAGLLASQWKVLSDECNMIMPANGTYIVYSTPFTAPRNYTLCSSGHAHVRKLFKISQSSANVVSDMSYKDKFLSVGQCVSSFITTQELGIKILENMQNICGKIPIQNLSFIHNNTISKDIHRFVG